MTVLLRGRFPHLVGGIRRIIRVILTASVASRQRVLAARGRLFQQIPECINNISRRSRCAATRAKKPTGYGSPCTAASLVVARVFPLPSILPPAGWLLTRPSVLSRQSARSRYHKRVGEQPLPPLDLYCYTLSSSFLVSGPARIGRREAARGGLSMPRVRTFRGRNLLTAAFFSELAGSVGSQRVFPDPLCASPTLKTLPPRPLSGTQ